MSKRDLTNAMSLLHLEMSVLMKTGDPSIRDVADALSNAHALARDVVIAPGASPHDVDSFFEQVRLFEAHFFPGVQFHWGLPDDRLWDDDSLWRSKHWSDEEALSHAQHWQDRQSKMGRPRLVRQGGDWTPQILRAELDRRKMSLRELGELFEPTISDVAVHKWLRKGIPDSRQEQLTEIFNRLDPWT